MACNDCDWLTCSGCPYADGYEDDCESKSDEQDYTDDR